MPLSALSAVPPMVSTEVDRPSFPLGATPSCATFEQNFDEEWEGGTEVIVPDSIQIRIRSLTLRFRPVESENNGPTAENSLLTVPVHLHKRSLQ